MKDVGTAAPRRQIILVTGFGAFPGARHNPTAELLVRLNRSRHRLARLGLDLRCELLPVVYVEIAPRLATVIGAHRPHAILHLGLASRRRHLSVETRAVNRANPLHPDASGRLPPHQVLQRGAPSSLRSTFHATAIRAVLRRGGFDTRLSIDAGDYVCNATLYASLRDGRASNIGFLHVPRIRGAARPASRCGRPRPTLERLTEAAFAVILAMRQSQGAG